MSLHRRWRPSLFHAGPSDHRIGLPLTSPCHRRWIVVLPWVMSPNAGSIVITSGSLKYVLGAPFGPKSRGGLVVVVGGVAGPAPPGGFPTPWSAGAAKAPVGPTATAPATAATALINVRLAIWPSASTRILSPDTSEMPFPLVPLLVVGYTMFSARVDRQLIG